MRSSGRRSGPIPRSVNVLVTDAQGKEVQALRDAWRSEGAQSTDAWNPVQVPAPRTAGAYGVVFEAMWPDGSTSRSTRTGVQVKTKAQAELEDSEFRAGSAALMAVLGRAKTQGIDWCDTQKAMAWLRAQPEVQSVTPGEGGYSYQVRKNPSGVLVHCH